MVKFPETSIYKRLQYDFDKFCDGEKKLGAITR